MERGGGTPTQEVCSFWWFFIIFLEQAFPSPHINLRKFATAKYRVDMCMFDCYIWIIFPKKETTFEICINYTILKATGKVALVGVKSMGLFRQQQCTLFIKPVWIIDGKLTSCFKLLAAIVGYARSWGEVVCVYLWKRCVRPSHPVLWIKSNSALLSLKRSFDCLNAKKNLAV